MPVENERLCKASAETDKLVWSGYAEPPPKVHLYEAKTVAKTGKRMARESGHPFFVK